jgi:hypothetical protein
VGWSVNFKIGRKLLFKKILKDRKSGGCLKILCLETCRIGIIDFIL